MWLNIEENINLGYRMTGSRDPILVLLCLELFMFTTIDRAARHHQRNDMNPES